MMQTNAWTLAGIVGLAGSWGCGDAQAPLGYRGEPLMSLQGKVTSSESTLTEDLVPALVFYEDMYAGDKPGTSHFVQGEVDGEFPSSFTMRVYEPPPAATLDAMFPGEPAFAEAIITAVAPAHPAWLRETHHEREEGAPFRVCSEAECIVGDFLDCEPGVQDPGDLWPCGNKFPDRLPWTSYGHARRHSVIYFASDVPEGSVLAHLYGGGSAIAAGYHVVEKDEDEYVVRTHGACYERTDARVNIEWNRRTGRNDPEGVTTINPGAENREHTVLWLTYLAEEGCDSGVRIVDDARIELQFVDGKPVHTH